MVQKKPVGSEPSFSSSGTLSSSKDINGRDIENTTANREINIQSKFPRQVLKPKPFREFIGHKLDILDIAWSKVSILIILRIESTDELCHRMTFY